ncbi:hypothetical protein, partial [Acinetobacter baumannii]
LRLMNVPLDKPLNTPENPIRR